MEEKMTHNMVNTGVKELTPAISEALEEPLYVMAVDEHNNVTFWTRPGTVQDEDYIVNDPPDFPKEGVSSILHIETESKYCYCKNGKVWCCKMINGLEICWKTNQSCG
jgi:hypothetical protein